MCQLLIIAMFLAVPAPKSKTDEKAELAALVGTWEIVGTEMDGKALDDDGRKAYEKDVPLLKTLIIKEKGRYDIHLDGEDSKSIDLPYKIDFSSSPRIVHWSLQPSNWALQPSNNPENYGIYTIEKDTLKLAVNLKEVQSKERMPKEFKTKKGDGNYIYIFKRVKVK